MGKGDGFLRDSLWIPALCLCFPDLTWCLDYSLVLRCVISKGRTAVGWRVLVFVDWVFLLLYWHRATDWYSCALSASPRNTRTSHKPQYRPKSQKHRQNTQNGQDKKGRYPEEQNNPEPLKESEEKPQVSQTSSEKQGWLTPPCYHKKTQNTKPQSKKQMRKNQGKTRKTRVFFDTGGGQGAGSKFIWVPIFYLGTGRGMGTIWTDGLPKIFHPKTPRVNPGEKDTTIFFLGGSQRHSKTMSPGTHKNTFSQIITKALKRVKPQPSIPRNPMITGKIGTRIILPQNSTIFQTQHALKPWKTLSFRPCWPKAETKKGEL